MRATPDADRSSTAPASGIPENRNHPPRTVKTMKALFARAALYSSNRILPPVAGTREPFRGLTSGDRFAASSREGRKELVHSRTKTQRGSLIGVSGWSRAHVRPATSTNTPLSGRVAVCLRNIK
jgi:hypothetical protein